MTGIGRNEPCPCGSGKKFKKCHMGREEELVLNRMQYLPEGAAEKIISLPEVDYGRSKEVASRLDLEKLTGAAVGLRFIDLGAYLNLGFVAREKPEDLDLSSAGQMVNPFKTMTVDPKNLYLAITPAISESTLMHQLAHALDYLAGSKNNPGLAKPLSMEAEAPLELIEHPREFGGWLKFLANEFGVTLDAEDTIVVWLYEKGLLIPGQIIKSGDRERIRAEAKRIIEFIRKNRAELDERIKGREGYLEDRA